MNLLQVDELTIRYAASKEPAVDRLSFSIEAGDSLGVVGESGAGKTQTALALMGLLPAHAEVSGSIRFAGTELAGAPPGLLRQIRGTRIAMVFQDPQAALNPYLTIGDQLRQIPQAHRLCGKAEAKERALAMLNTVGLADQHRIYHAYPHQLSGGMRQRALIGAALIGEPDLIVADEPTTSLDVTVQAQILRLLRELRDASNTAMLLITHDLGVIAGNCERVLVMDRGRMIECGMTRAIYRSPTSPRTATLLAAALRIKSKPLIAPLPPDRATVLQVSGMSVSFDKYGEEQRMNAVLPVSLSLREGETLAIVGESGSGKTTLARAILGLLPPDSGTVTLAGKRLSPTLPERTRAERRQLQMVFQDPQSSLNPAMRVFDIVSEPLLVHEPGKEKAALRAAVHDMLQRVGLSRAFIDRFPHELSGGQAQRVAISRALIVQPRVLVCDEAVAALDGSVRQEILDVLRAEQQNTGLSLLFISHDLAVVRQISHRVLVMYLGRVFELGDNETFFRRPRHPYSKALLNAVPLPDPDSTFADQPLRGEVASLLSPPKGCPFHPRCDLSIARCQDAVPEIENIGGTRVACHRAAELDLSY